MDKFNGRTIYILVAICLLFFSIRCFAAGLPFRETPEEFASGTFNGTELSSCGVILVPNLIKNPGFEDGFNNWEQNNAVLGTGKNGANSARLVATGSGNPQGARTSDFIPVENNSSIKYTVSAWLKCNITTGNYYFRIIYFDSNGTEISHYDLKYFSSSSDWTYFTTTVGGSGSGASVIFPSNCVKIKIDHCWWNSSNNPSGEGWMDDVIFMRGAAFTGSGIFTSRVYDCGEKMTFGRLTWIAETSSGCSIVFNTRSGTTVSDLLAEDWSDTYYTSGKEVVSEPGRYVQYRAVLYSSNSSISPVLKEVKITSPIRGVLASPSFILRAGEKLKLELSFDIDMDPLFNPTVSIVPEFGDTMVIPGAGGSWSGLSFIAGETIVPGFLGNGFATVKTTNGRTANGFELFSSSPGVLIVDNEGFIAPGKITFFPDPFSPNGDGKCDQTKLLFSLDSPTPITVRIYDLKGTLVRTLVENQTYYGSTQISWDGTDCTGKILPVGVYLYQAQIGSRIITGTVVLVK